MRLVIRGIARENDAIDEARAESVCMMGVGCGTAGVCFAEANGVPEMCCKNTLSEPPFCAKCGGTCRCDDWINDV